MREGTTGQRTATQRLTALAAIVTIAAEDDPFAAAGFYDGASQRTVTVDAFHFGLLPASRSLADKHVVSVISVTAPVWGLVLATAWRGRRRRAVPRVPAHSCHRC